MKLTLPEVNVKRKIRLLDIATQALAFGFRHQILKSLAEARRRFETRIHKSELRYLNAHALHTPGTLALQNAHVPPWIWFSSIANPLRSMIIFPHV